MTTHFGVRVTKDDLVFSAAHFITFGDNVCERLHGHNYRVEVDIRGPLGPHGYVVDFVAVRRELQRIVGQLDHHVLLPLHHPAIRVQATDSDVEVKFEDRRWAFPRGDCVLLPVSNTTAELLAQWIAMQLMSATMFDRPDGVLSIRVSVDENHGQWGTFESQVPPQEPNIQRDRSQPK
ncbi:MAG TPA: 6-pyruvoyl tetrahydropterin synthase family protein [Pirellulaceae bacterium]